MGGGQSQPCGVGHRRATHGEGLGRGDAHAARARDLLRDGLPQRDAYDLIYRHGLDVDATGTQLAMGSTTGGLWTTGNGGERWSLVSAHLPPVYAVRFV
mgnify:CR=1 FL=1